MMIECVMGGPQDGLRMIVEPGRQSVTIAMPKNRDAITFNEMIAGEFTHHRYEIAASQVIPNVHKAIYVGQV